VAIDKYKADIIFEFDADLQHDPSIIPLMLAQIEHGSSLVLGSRYVRGGGIPRTWPWYRKFLSIVGNIYIRVIMGNFQIHDWTTGYRAIAGSILPDIMPGMHEAAFHGYAWQIGFLVKTIQKGYKVTEVQFFFRDRQKGHSKLGPEYIFNTMRYIMKARFDQILHSRILKFLLVGGFGTLIQLIALHFYRLIFQVGLGSLLTAYQIALILAIETAIVSNFTWSNLWTFKDRKLKPIQIPAKFVQFNLASGGSIINSSSPASVSYIITTFEFSISVSNLVWILAHLHGDLGRHFWNFFAYSHFVWKKK
jgi:dolichol-phosphate mannosyltransferase